MFSACGVNDNYSDRVIAVNGLKYDPYSVTRNGVYYADGKKYIGEENLHPQPANLSGNSINIPNACGGGY